MPANNYSLQQGGFEQGLQIAKFMAQKRKAAEVEQQKRARAETMNRDIGELQTSPTPDAYAKLYLKYPELKESLDAYRTTLADDEKQTLLGATREALTLRRAGRGGEVPAMFDRYAQALDGKPLAQKFKDAKRVYEIDPDKAGDFSLQTLFQSLDPDGHKAFFEQTAAVKNWEYFKEAIGEEDAKRVIGADDDVMVTTPNGGFYSGPRSGLAQAIGGAAELPRVTNAEEYAKIPPGSPYRDENGEKRFKPGEQTGKPSDNGPVSRNDPRPNASMISREDAVRMTKALGAKGFEAWLKNHGVRVQ